MHRIIRPIGLLALLASAPMLTACTLGISPDGPPDAAAPPTAPSVDGTDPAGTDPAVSETSTSSPATEPEADGGLPTRADLEPLVVTQLTCPTGSLDLTDTGFAVEVVEDCESVTVSGDAMSVLAQHVGALTVEGAGGITIVADADVVTVREGADASVVLWESGSPDVTDASVASVVMQGAAS